MIKYIFLSIIYQYCYLNRKSRSIYHRLSLNNQKILSEAKADIIEISDIELTKLNFEYLPTSKARQYLVSTSPDHKPKLVNLPMVELLEEHIKGKDIIANIENTRYFQFKKMLKYNSLTKEEFRQSVVSSWKKYIGLFESIKKYGYLNDKHLGEYIIVEQLKTGQQVEYIVRSGHHRASVLYCLGYDKCTVCMVENYNYYLKK
jgi:hypothetical protein